MKPLECEFEAEALAAALQSRWPNRVDESLRAHVEGCAVCADVIAVAAVLEETGGNARAAVEVPSASSVWWRSQVRARREAARAAGRPITAAQVIAFSCAAALLGACFGATSAWFQSVVAGFDGRTALAILAEHGALVLAAALLLLIPAAFWLAIGRD